MPEKIDVQITQDDIMELFNGSDEGKAFVSTMSIIEDIIDNPHNYSGPKALYYASKLAALRSKIGIYGNYRKSVRSDSITDRRKKDLLLSIEKNLEENINCLKLLGRVDISAAGGFR